MFSSYIKKKNFKYNKILKYFFDFNNIDSLIHLITDNFINDTCRQIIIVISLITVITIIKDIIALVIVVVAVDNSFVNNIIKVTCNYNHFHNTCLSMGNITGNITSYFTNITTNNFTCIVFEAIN